MRRTNSLALYINAIEGHKSWRPAKSKHLEVLEEFEPAAVKDAQALIDKYLRTDQYASKLISETLSDADDATRKVALYEMYNHVYSTKADAKDFVYYYRGVTVDDCKNAPGILRDHKHTEHYYFHEMRVRCPEAFKGMDNLEVITYMQHYGSPTRLLDITSNPLVALYFACSAQDDRDGLVYAFGIPTSQLRYSDSDRVLMLTELARLDKYEQDQLRQLAYDYILDGEFPSGKHGRYNEYDDEVVEKYYQAIRRDNGAFERQIVPFDLLEPQFVQPYKDNPRILKQDGAFIITGLDTDEADCDRKIQKNIVQIIRIPASIKKKIRGQLDSVGINEASLFPEVDKVAEYLRGR